MSAQSDVASNLRAIEDMAARLRDRAIDRSNARDIPGGDAMVELCHVGSIETWTNKIDGLERRWLDYLGLPAEDMPNWSEAEDPDKFWPAIEVLWFWTEDYRSQLGMDYDDPRWRPTLASEAAFLRNKDVADWIWDNETKYADYAKDVERAKTKLENVLIEGDRSERTPVVCDRCDDGRQLIKVYGEADEDDRWKCMGCKHEFTAEETSDALGTQMRRTEPREWVTRAEAIDLLRSMGHQGRTAAGLTDLPEARGWKHEVTKVRYVSWPDVWRAHLLALQAARIRLEDAKRAAAHKAMCGRDHGAECWIVGRGCAIVCPRGHKCEWTLCPVHTTERVSA